MDSEGAPEWQALRGHVTATATPAPAWGGKHMACAPFLQVPILSYSLKKTKTNCSDIVNSKALLCLPARYKMNSKNLDFIVSIIFTPSSTFKNFLEAIHQATLHLSGYFPHHFTFLIKHNFYRWIHSGTYSIMEIRNNSILVLTETKARIHKI